MNKLVGLLGLCIDEPLSREHGLADAIPRERRPVVFVGPYEHHSNLLPWLESTAEVVEIDADDNGQIDLAELERRLIEYAERPLRIGSFSAASNVTGVLTDVRAIARTLHRRGAVACFEGVVRNHNDGRDVTRLQYEGAPDLAANEFSKIEAEVRATFAIVKLSCVHRIGDLSIGDLAVWVGVSAAHRADAFGACRYIIDETKQRLPIWKKEHYPDGESEWLNSP